MKHFVRQPKEDVKVIHALEEELHRSYRKLHVGNLGYGMVSHILLFCLVAGLVVYNLGNLTRFYSVATFTLLKDMVPGLSIGSIQMAGTNVTLVHGIGRNPSPALLITVSLVSIAIFLLLKAFKNISLPVSLSLKMLCVMNLASCAFFIFWKSRFPYDLNSFSRLYLTAEMGMWVAIPFMLAFALLPIPVSIFHKAILVVFTNTYIYLLGIPRYALLIYVLIHFSYLWMALLYFTAVIFFDFACMIAFYSYYISLVTPQIIRRRGIWRWLYSS